MEKRHEQNIEIQRINCHHNFSQKENHFGKDTWITRKGAVQARSGQLGIVPGAMGTKSDVPKLVEDLGFVITRLSNGFMRLNHPDLILEFLTPERRWPG